MFGMGGGHTSESEVMCWVAGRGRRMGFNSSDDGTKARRAKAALLRDFFFIVPDVLVE